MKIVVAIDSFKGSLSSMEAGTTIKEAIKNVCDAEVIVKPWLMEEKAPLMPWLLVWVAIKLALM